MVSSDSFKLVTPVERIYRELSQPRPPKPATTPAPPPLPISLQYADVKEILANKRSASIEELEWILEHAKQFCLTVKQRNDISLRVTIALAGRDRPAPSPNAELFALLDIVETPRGLLHHRSWFEREMRMGAAAIARCPKNHSLDARCECWREFRERLWRVQDRFGANSPEAWAATRLYEQFEEFELASKPERTAGLNPTLMPIPE